MNIAILIPELGGGGAERVAQRLGKYYTEQGDHVFYFLLDTHQRRVLDVAGEIIDTGLPSCISNVDNGYRQVLLRLFVNASKIRALKRKYNIDTAISFMEECNYLNILSQRGEKVIVRICTILSRRDDLNDYVCDRKIIRFFYSMPCQIVVMSRYAVRDMIWNYHIRRRKLTLIPNGCDTHIQAESKPAQYGEHCVLAVGRLDPVKRHDRLIRAFSYTVSKVEDAELVIVGAGANERYLKSLCQIYGIETKVHFTGFRHDVANYFAISKVFVMCSVVEGFPNSMIEAMACGVPVISTNSPGGCGDILGKKIRHAGYWMCRYGILTPEMPGERVNPRDEICREERILGKAMADMLMNHNMRDKYQKASRARAEYYNEEKVYKMWDRIVRR